MSAADCRWPQVAPAYHHEIDNELQADQDDETDKRLCDADIVRQHAIGEGGPQRDGDDQVECVLFSQRSLPGQPLERPAFVGDDDREVCCGHQQQHEHDRNDGTGLYQHPQLVKHW
jgi:hypothetical protein